MDLEQFKKYLETNRAEIQRAIYEEIDRDVNGDDAYYEGLGRLVEEHPIASAGIRGSRCGHID